MKMRCASAIAMMLTDDDARVIDCHAVFKSGAIRRRRRLC